MMGQDTTNQFQIPAPYKAWCHLCKQGFMTIDEATQHDRANLNKHQALNEKVENAKTSKKS